MIKSYNFSIYRFNSKILQNKYKLQLNNYKELEKSQDNLRKIYHDINNHNIILYSLISNNEYEKALSYLNQFNLDLKMCESQLFTKHKILNALLISKYNVCKNNEINLDMDVNIPSTLPISDFNLCILVGNIMDNAIEACEYLNEDKYIKVCCKLVNDNFTFQVINSYNGNISSNKGTFLSIKKDKLNHGLGIANVKSIINELNGNYYFNFSNKEFCVIITIPL